MKEQSRIREYMKNILTDYFRIIGKDIIECNHSGDTILVTNDNGNKQCYVIHCVKPTIQRIPTQTAILLRDYDQVTVLAPQKLQDDIVNILPVEVGLMVVDLENDKLIVIVK